MSIQKGPSQLFDERHGSDCIQIQGDSFRGYLVYSDGAMRERSAYGAMSEPPVDPLERAKVQLVYHEELLRRATEDFDACKQNLLSLAQATYRGEPLPPPESEIERLNRLADVVRERRKTYQAAQERVEELTPANVKGQDAERARRRQQCDDFIASVRSIKV